MKTRTVCLPPGELIPGMVITSPICGPQGAVLIAAGTVLDETALEQLRRRNLAFLSVQINDPRDADTVAADIATVAARVAYIFRGEGCDQRGALRRVIDAYRRRMAE
jgi:hypothetical protein